MDKSTCALKLPLFLKAEQARSVDGQSKICNWLSNHLLEKANKLKEEYKNSGDSNAAKTLYTKHGLRNLLRQLKIDKPFLKAVHSSPLKKVALRLSKTIRAYQSSRKGNRAGKPVGWPKFRSFKKRFFSLEYEEPNKGYKLHDGFLEISLGLGEENKRHHLMIAMPDSRALKNKEISGLRIIKESKVYFAIFTIKKALPAKKMFKRVISLDPNHKNLAYGVDNASEAIEIEPPHWLKNYDKRIDELKSKRDRCKKKSRLIDITDDKGEVIKQYFKPSRRYQKYQQVLQRAHMKRREQTKTYQFTVANALCKHYDLVQIGDYTPKGGGLNTKMRRAMNNGSLIGKFKKTLAWCGDKSGKSVFEWDEKGSTRTCHACLKAVEGGIKPNVRLWKCQHCNKQHIRDENSAINGIRNSEIIKRAPSLLGAVPSSGPVSIEKRWAWRVLPSGVHRTLRGEDSFTKSDRQEIKMKDWEPSTQIGQDYADIAQL